MTLRRTAFAGYPWPAVGDPLSEDGYAFQTQLPPLADRLGQLGAVTHRHDGHAALANPTLAPTLATASSGGGIPAATSISFCYTLVDADGGETLPVAAVTITTAAGFLNPFDAPTAVVSYAAGTLLPGNYSFAVTVTDGLGGETTIGPARSAIVDPGHANAEVTLGALDTALLDSSGGAGGAAWRLWRQKDGGPWYLIGTGTGASLLDNGIAGDCTVSPPSSNTTKGASTFTATIPGGQPAAAVSFNTYASVDGSFTSPAFLGNHPTAGGAATVITYTSLLPTEGSPPTVSRSFPGANQIDPSTDVLGGGFASLTSVQTLTNKRITRRVVAVTQSATPAIDSDNLDVASITGLAQAITSMTTNLTGTPVDGDELTVRLTDDGTARAITWGAKFEPSTVALPTTTVISTLLIVQFVWNPVASAWRCILAA